MPTISGQVVLLETGAGIRGLQVVLSAGLPTGPAGTNPNQSSESLGSVLTDQTGSFTLAHGDDTSPNAGSGVSRRPLSLQVLAPEEPGLPAGRVLYASSPNGRFAGKTEQCLIRLSSDLLTKFRIGLPSDSEDETETASGRVARLKNADVRSSAILDGAFAVAKSRVDAHRERFVGFTTKLSGALQTAISTVPTAVFQPQRFVKEGESPAVKNLIVIQQNLKEVVNSNDPSKRAPAKGLIFLTQEDANKIKSQASADGTLPESAIAAIAPTPSTTFLQRSPLLPLCRPHTTSDDACAAALADPATSGPPSPGQPPPVVSGNGVTPITTGDVPRFMARLMDPQTAPEEELVVGLMPTATNKSVQQSVQDLNFSPSPADVPAFHDFNQLQIAFQHVWQELTDKGIINLARDAYESIVELGGDPNRPEHSNLHPVDAIKLEAQFALRANRLTPRPVVRDHRNENGSALNGITDFLGGLFGQTEPARAVPVHNFPVKGFHIQGVYSTDPAERLPALLTELETKLREKYTFTIFAANEKERSINFGILNTFRQIWTPLSYQAGALVKSIPLAPKQTQKISITRKLTKKRSRKEVENNLRVLKQETSETTRAEDDIARRASASSEFAYTNSATAGVDEIGSDTTTTSFKQNASKSSEDTKKAFHESVFKAAQEFKNERTTEVTSETVEEMDTTETTEISNPNDEIAVTFLFYELQRRYRLHETLFRVTPVVLVAQEVPSPDQIDQAWLIAHDWILKRVILDDSFLPTLITLCDSAGAETALLQLEANVNQQRQIVTELRSELAIAQRMQTVQDGVQQRAVVKHSGSSGLLGDLVGGVANAVSGVAGAVGGAVEGAVNTVEGLLFKGDPDANQANRQALESSADRAADRARDLIFRLEREVTALNSITETFSKALQSHHNHLTEIARLRLHVKENILYYMQAIWRHEPPDQRYFRLHNVPIPTFKQRKRNFRIDFANPVTTVLSPPHETLPRFGGRRLKAFPVETLCQFSDQMEFAPLAEVADLDNFLGFKGNYMIFPLLESNPLTDYMMEPYVDRASGELLDPSDPAGWSLDEFTEYVACLKEHLSPTEFETLRPSLKQQYETLLSTPQRGDDILVVPTNSLFIEALPAGHSLIERFKAAHRMIDVKAAQEKLRGDALENVRRAARLLADEREDPNIDHRVLIQGSVPGVVVPTPT